MSNSNDSGRRGFIKLGLSALAVAPLATLLSRTVDADDHSAPLLSEDDPAAVGLGYVHDASEVDVARFPKRAGEAGSKQFCHNCALYQGNGKDGAAGCAIFPGKLVKAQGWCNAWVAGNSS